MINLQFHWHIIIFIAIVGFCLFNLGTWAWFVLRNGIYSGLEWFDLILWLLILVATVGIYGGIFWW